MKSGTNEYLKIASEKYKKEETEETRAIFALVCVCLFIVGLVWLAQDLRGSAPKVKVFQSVDSSIQLKK